MIIAQRLNLGSGARPLAGAVNLDISNRVGADVVHDLNRMPWPFGNDTFDEVHAYDVIEHLHDVVRSLEEIHRIARDGAIVHIAVPHFSSANTFTDVTHRHAFGWHSLDPVLESATPHPLGHYSGVRFRRVSGRILLPSVANQQGGRSLRQSMARCLRATVGLGIPRVVHFASTGSRQARAMKVAHLVPAIFGADGIVGGAERYAMELARHMASRLPTRLVTFGCSDRREQIGALEIRVLGAPWHVRGQRGNPFHRGLFSALGDADVVHCHQQHVLMSSAAAAWCRLRGKRVFVSELGGGGWDVSAYVSTDAWFHGHLHLSEYSRRIFRHEQLASARVIGGGVDTERFSPDGAIARTGTVLFVGRALPHKGIDDLIRGLPTTMALTIAGPQPDREYAAVLARLAAQKHVTFKEGLDDDQLVLEYRRALCVVLPSVYRTASGLETAVPELLGQTLLEGMACEAPTICTNVASMPEIVENETTGYVVPPNAPESIGARLQMLHDSPDRARAMGKAGRRRVLESFTWDAVVTRCIAAYSEDWHRARPDRPAPLAPGAGSTPD